MPHHRFDVSLWARQNDPGSFENFDSDRVASLSKKFIEIVGDRALHPSVPQRLARAICDSQVSLSEVTAMMDTIWRLRSSGELRSPGAYFTTSVRNLFKRQGVPWRT